MASTSMASLCSFLSSPRLAPGFLLPVAPSPRRRRRWSCRSPYSNPLRAPPDPHFPLRLPDSTTSRLRIFSGTANPTLAQEIACYLGLELGKIKIKRFADGELYVQLQESVRGCDVFLVQPTCPPANENLMELLIMVDACRRASAKTITAVVPYFGARRPQDAGPRVHSRQARRQPHHAGWRAPRPRL
jgi:ribose-phosphate pyrophosphokinase